MSCTKAFTNTPITTTDTAGTRRLDLFGNHELIPKTETHLVLPGIACRVKKSARPLSSSSDLDMCLSSSACSVFSNPAAILPEKTVAIMLMQNKVIPTAIRT
ncbi:MAG: hypothetical protein DLM72_07750 [Candidatus Nitrosopolaris wilkensis]|nr:MAG: hypothetical protein DLM72_07750 [Candidatus Nitrosopolaris wilkensis]